MTSDFSASKKDLEKFKFPDSKISILRLFARLSKVKLLVNVIRSEISKQKLAEVVLIFQEFAEGVADASENSK